MRHWGTLTFTLDSESLVRLSRTCENSEKDVATKLEGGNPNYLGNPQYSAVKSRWLEWVLLKRLTSQSEAQVLLLSGAPLIHNSLRVIYFMIRYIRGRWIAVLTVISLDFVSQNCYTWFRRMGPERIMYHHTRHQPSSILKLNTWSSHDDLVCSQV